MTQFKTLTLGNGQVPRDDWLDAVREYGRFVWIRFSGHAEREPIEEPELLAWEQAARKLTPEALRPCAYIRVRSNWFQGLTWAEGLHGRYLRWSRYAGRGTAGVKHLAQYVRAGQPHPVGIFAEDFSARWVLDSGFTPAVAVLDSPVVSKNEMVDRYIAALDWPGYVRSGLDLSWCWSRLRMHFDHDELLQGIPCGRHARWRTDELSDAERESCLVPRAIAWSLNR